MRWPTSSSGPPRWSRSRIAAAATSQTGAQTISYGNALTLGGGLTYVNHGSLTIDGGLLCGDAAGAVATLVNSRGATIDLGNEIGGNYSSVILSEGTVENQGLIKASYRYGYGTSIGSRLDSTGTIELSANLELRSGGNLTGVVSGAYQLILGDGSFTVDGLSTLGGAAVILAGGTLVVGAGTTPAVHIWGGEIDGPASYTLTATTDLRIGGYDEPALTLGGGATIRNTGTVNTGFGLRIGTSDGDRSSWINQAGASLAVFDVGTRVYGSGTLQNAGTILTDSHAVTDFGDIYGRIIISTTIDNSGVIEVGRGTLELTHSVSGHGHLVIDAGATLDLGGMAGSQVIRFGGAGAGLRLETPQSIPTPMAGFGAGDTLDLVGVTVTTITTAGHVLDVTTGSGEHLRFTSTRDLSNATVRSSDDERGGTVLSLAARSPGGGQDFAGSPLADILVGTNATDVLDGGGGNDTLAGKGGRDTYVVSAADVAAAPGTVTIVNGGNSGGAGGTLRLGFGRNDLGFSQAGNDLRVSVLGRQQTVVVKGWFDTTTPWRRLGSVQLADGSRISAAVVTGLAQGAVSKAHPSFAPIAAGSLPAETPGLAAPVDLRAHAAEIADGGGWWLDHGRSGVMAALESSYRDILAGTSDPSAASTAAFADPAILSLMHGEIWHS